MSVTAAPDAPAAEWSLEGALSDSGFMDDFRGLPGADANTPPAVSDQPSSEQGQAKPAATEGEPKAQTPATEATAPDAEGDGEAPKYTEKQYERSRAEANRQRDLAKQEADRAAAELNQHRQSLSENEFQRGVQLRQIQLIENLTLQKGQLDLADIRACQIQAFQDMQGARDSIIQADLTRVQQEAAQGQWTQQQIDASNSKAEALFNRHSLALQKEASAAGVGTFDAETALQDILYSAEYQAEISDLNSLPADKQQAASDRLYERAKRDVRTKMQMLVTAKQPAAQPQQVIPTQQEIAAEPTVRGFNVSDAFERTFGDSGNYEAILQANPSLRGR